MIELIRVKLQHTPLVYALPTMVDIRTRFAKRMIEDVRGAFGEHVLSGAIRQTVTIKESQAQGLSLVQYNSQSRGALDYLILSQEILSKVASQTMDEKRTPLLSDRLKDFVLKAPDVREVHLVGDFNNWCMSGDSLLWQKEEGLWQKRVFLEPGRYRYKFVIDGKWVTDPLNDRLEPNPYGGVDSVLEIE